MIGFYLFIFVLVCICICISICMYFYFLPSCSAAAAVGDLDKSAAPSQIHLQPVTFICATVWPQRNTFDRLEEIQLIKWQKYNRKGEINPVEILTKYSHLIPSFAPTFMCVSSFVWPRHLLPGPRSALCSENTSDTNTDLRNIKIRALTNTCWQLSSVPPSGLVIAA